MAKKSPKTKKSSKPQVARPYPRRTLEDALRVPYALKQFNGGNPWASADLANGLDMAKGSSTFFYLTAASRDFGLTQGTRDTATINLTDFGRSLVYADNEKEEQRLTREAFLSVDLFRRVLEHYKGPDLPEMKYVSNTLTKEFQLDESVHEEFINLFRKNTAFLKLHAGFEVQRRLTAKEPTEEINEGLQDSKPDVITLAEPEGDSNLHCFVIMPFRERNEGRPKGFFEEVLRSIIAPAGKKAGFIVTTANRDGSDVIQSTIVNNLLDADLVVADLTEHNPNVLFELGMRMAFDKPVALIRSKGTGQIFDVDNMLRVYDYDPNLWLSTVEHDIPQLTIFIKATWNNRDKENTYLKILRKPPALI